MFDFQIQEGFYSISLSCWKLKNKFTWMNYNIHKKATKNSRTIDIPNIRKYLWNSQACYSTQSNAAAVNLAKAFLTTEKATILLIPDKEMAMELLTAVVVLYWHPYQFRPFCWWARAAGWHAISAYLTPTDDFRLNLGCCLYGYWKISVGWTL